MIVFVEKKTPSESTIALKNIAEMLRLISTGMSQIARKLTILEFSESYFEEGSAEDRKFVANKIIELQGYVSKLDEVALQFDRKDLQTSFEEKRSAVNRAQIEITAIWENMLLIWGMKDSGDTPEDNEKIKTLILKMFNVVNTLIHHIAGYITDFNTISARKLSFKVKWTAPPK
jgi:hypothetical protein